jgi:hypothetical protein
MKTAGSRLQTRIRLAPRTDAPRIAIRAARLIDGRVGIPIPDPVVIVEGERSRAHFR